MLAAKNSQKRLEASGPARNNAGGIVLTAARSRGPLNGISSAGLMSVFSSRLPRWHLMNDNVLYHSSQQEHRKMFSATQPDHSAQLCANDQHRVLRAFPRVHCRS